MSYFPWAEFSLANYKNSYSKEDYASNTIIKLSTFKDYLKYVQDTTGLLVIRIRHSRHEFPSPSEFIRVYLYKSCPEPQIQNILSIKNSIMDSFDLTDLRSNEDILEDVCKRSLIKNEKVFYFVG